VRKLRVLVANRPHLMREAVLETLSNQPDLEVVGETGIDSEVAELVDTTRPDCVIVALDENVTRLGLCGFLLGRYPQMKVLAVASERGSSVVYWAVIDIRSKQVETSEDGLLGALRSFPELIEAKTGTKVNQ
jgi:DNA-binding NarL/FixJ family response regulator